MASEREDLARLIAPAAYVEGGQTVGDGWRETWGRYRAEEAADAALAAGYRRVVVDDVTVKRVARAVDTEASSICAGWKTSFAGRIALAAVRALRGDGDA